MYEVTITSFTGQKITYAAVGSKDQVLAGACVKAEQKFRGSPMAEVVLVEKSA